MKHVAFNRFIFFIKSKSRIYLNYGLKFCDLKIYNMVLGVILCFTNEKNYLILLDIIIKKLTLIVTIWTILNDNIFNF